MNKLFALLSYNVKRILSDKTTILFAFLMPIGFYILMSMMFQGEEDGLYKFLTAAMLPNYLVIIISNALFNVFGVLMVDTISTGNIVKYKLLGISKFKYATALLGSVLLLELVVSIVFITFVALMNVSIVPKNVLSSCVILMLIHLFQFAVTFLLTAMIDKASSYAGVSMTIFMIQMFTGGLTFPVSMFPDTLQTVLRYINPMTHASTALQNTWIQGYTILEEIQSVMILLIVISVCIGGGLWINKVKHKSQTIPAI